MHALILLVMKQNEPAAGTKVMLYVLMATAVTRVKILMPTAVIRVMLDTHANSCNNSCYVNSCSRGCAIYLCQQL